jgi:predicted nucleic acid-binding protein
MVKYLIDTNIFIAILKGDAKLKSFIENLDGAIDTTVYAELIQGSKNKSEVQKSNNRRGLNCLILTKTFRKERPI